MDAEGHIYRGAEVSETDAVRFEGFMEEKTRTEAIRDAAQAKVKAFDKALADAESR